MMGSAARSQLLAAPWRIVCLGLMWAATIALVVMLGVCGDQSNEQPAGEPSGRKIAAPPGGGVYLGAYNWRGIGVQTFEWVLGRKVAIGNPYPVHDGGTENTWPSFDKDGHERNWQAGYVTWTGIETSLRGDNPRFITQDVIDGEIDTRLASMAQEIAAWSRPIFWMYPREPCIQPGPGYDGGGYGRDGDLTRSEAVERGQGDKGQYGATEQLDGPERYVDMCRHIHDVVAPIAPNVTWVMGAIVCRQPGAYKRWYPGDEYIDWHALDVYTGESDVPGTGGELVPFMQVVEPT